MRRGEAARPLREEEVPSAQDLEDGMDGVRPAGMGRILMLARPEWLWLALGMIFLAGSLAPALILPLVFGKMFDTLSSSLSDDEQRQEINRSVLLLMVILAVSTVSAMLRSFIFNTAGERVVARLRLRLFQAIISQEIGMFDKRKTGELLSRLGTDTVSLQDVATVNLSMFVRSIVMMGVSLGLMFYSSWKLTCLTLVVVPLVISGAAVYSKVVKRLATQYSDALSRASDTAQESISNIRTVRSFAAEELEIAKYVRAVGDPDRRTPGGCWWLPPRKELSTYALGVKKQLAVSCFTGFVTVAGFGAAMAIVWYGSNLVIDGELSQGRLVAFALYAVQIGVSLGMLSGISSSVFVAVGASKRTFQLIDRKPLVPWQGGTYPNALAVGNIKFENVHFAYPSRNDVPVLVGFNLDVPANCTYAFVGTSGAGKSTVLSLLQRFYDVADGSVQLDGCDIRGLDPRYVRRSMAHVAQEPVLFGVTLAENIAYGHAACNGDPTAKPLHNQIVLASQAAFADKFIMEFPDGYDTLVGERGVRLSGGQKQRVAIARALLNNPRVLLLDEATSALDSESEHLVQRAIDALMVDRTTLVVAHRLSTVRHADKIIVVEGGRKEAEGAHEELMDKSAKYRDLVRRQLQVGPEEASANELNDLSCSVE